MSVLGHHTTCSLLLISLVTIVTLPCHILSQTVQTGCDNATCQNYCPAGYFQDPDTGVCTMCPAGFYQDLTQQTTCKPCPAESTTKTAGATSVTQCTEHPLWKTYAFWLRLALSWTSDLQANSSSAYALLWSNLVTPVNNSLQTLSSYRGSLHLVAFAPGSVLVYMEATLFTTSTTLADLTAVVSALCNKGTVGNISIDTTAGIDSSYGVAFKGNLVCSQGQYFSYSTGTCVYCDVTSYQPIGVSDVCFSCPQGYSTGQQGTVGDSSSCLFVCASGWQQVPGLAVCQLCPTGTYKSQAGPLSCTACPAGFTTPSIGSLLPSNCTVPVGSGCSVTLCDLGYQCRWDVTQAKAMCYCPGTITGNTCTANNQTTINTTVVIVAAVTCGAALTIVVIIVCAVLCLRRRKKSQLTQDKDNNVLFIRVNGESAHKIATRPVVMATADKPPPVMPAIADTQHKAVSVQTSDASHVTASVPTSVPAAVQSPPTFSSAVFSPGALFYDESEGITFDDDTDKPVKAATDGAQNFPQTKVKVKTTSVPKAKKASTIKVKKSNSSSKPSPQTPTPIGSANGHVTKTTQSQAVSQPFDPPIQQQQQQPPKQTMITTPAQPKQSVEPTVIDRRPPQHMIDAHNNRVHMTQSLRMYNPQLVLAQPNAMGYPIQQFNNMEFPSGYPLITDGHMHHMPPMEFPMEFPMDMFPQSRDPGRRRRHHDSAQRRRHHYPSERRAHHRPLAGDGHASKRHRPMKRHTHAQPPENNTYDTIDPADVMDSQPIGGSNFILKSPDQPIGNQPDVEQSPYESIPADSVI